MTKPKQKARSRLQRRLVSKTRNTARKKRVNQAFQPFAELLLTYLKYWPLLLLSIIFYSGVYWLIGRFHPEEIRNWLLPNSFIPFHVLLFLGNFFLFTFLTLSRRWGLLLSLLIQWLFFLKMQNFTLDLWAWGSAGLIGLGGYLIRALWKRKMI